MFENPRRSRQARNLITNVLKILDLKSSYEQIFSENWRWVPLTQKTRARTKIQGKDNCDVSWEGLWTAACKRNGPFPSSKNSLFQNEAKCTTSVVKRSFILRKTKSHFHINGFAFSLAFKQTLGATRKWPIEGEVWKKIVFVIRLDKC